MVDSPRFQAVNPTQRTSSMQQGHSQPLPLLHHTPTMTSPHANLNAPPPPPLGGSLPRLPPQPPLPQHPGKSHDSHFRDNSHASQIQDGSPHVSQHLVNTFQHFPPRGYMGHSGLPVPDESTSRQHFLPPLPFHTVSGHHSPPHHHGNVMELFPPFPTPQNQQVAPFPGPRHFYPPQQSDGLPHVQLHSPLPPLMPPPHLPPIEHSHHPASPLPLPPLYGPHHRSFSLQPQSANLNAASPPMFHNSLPSRFLNGDYLGSTPPHYQGSPSRVGFGSRFANAPVQQLARGGGGANTPSHSHLPIHSHPRTQLHERTQSGQFGTPRSSRTDEKAPSMPGSILPRLSFNQGLKGIHNQHHHRLSSHESHAGVGEARSRALQSRFSQQAAETGSPLGSNLANLASSTGGLGSSRESRAASQTLSPRALSKSHLSAYSELQKSPQSAKPMVSLPISSGSQRDCQPTSSAHDDSGSSKQFRNIGASSTSASSPSPSTQHAKVASAPLTIPPVGSSAKKKRKKKGIRAVAAEVEIGSNQNQTQPQTLTPPVHVTESDNTGTGNQALPPRKHSDAFLPQSANKTRDVQSAKSDTLPSKASTSSDPPRIPLQERTMEEYPFYLGNVGYHPCQNAQCSNVYSYLREVPIELDEASRYVDGMPNNIGISAQHSHLSTMLVPDFIPPPAWARLSICGCTLCRDCFSEVIANCHKEPPAMAKQDAQPPKTIDSGAGKRFFCTVCSSTVSDFGPVNLELTMAALAETASSEAVDHPENVTAASGHVDSGHAIAQAPLETFDDFVSAQTIARPAESAPPMASRHSQQPAGGNLVATIGGPEAGQLELATIRTSEGTTEADPPLEFALTFPSLYDPSHVVKVSLPVRKVSAASMDSADSPVPPTPDLAETGSSSASSSAPPSPEITLSPHMALPVVYMPFKGRMESMQASFSEKTGHITQSEKSMASSGLGISFDSSPLPILTSAIAAQAIQNASSRTATPDTPLTGNPIQDQAISTPRGAKSLQNSERSPARAAMAGRAVRGLSGTWQPSGSPRSRTNTDISRHSRQSSSSSGNSSYTRKVSAGENRQGGRLPAIFANPTPDMVSEYETSRARWWLDPWTGSPMGIKQGQPNGLGTSVMRRSDGKMLVDGQAANVSWPILKVHNISFDTTIADIEGAVPPQTLAPLVYNAQAIHLPCNVLDGQTLPYAYVECISDDAADRIMQELNGKVLAGRQIAIRPITQKELVMDLYPTLRQADHPRDSVLLAEYEKASAWHSGRSKDDIVATPHRPVSSVTRNNLILFSPVVDTQLRGLVDAALYRGYDQRENHQGQQDKSSPFRGPPGRPFARLASMIAKYPCRLVDGCPPAGIALREAELKRLFDCLLYTLERLCRDTPFLLRITGTCKALFRAGLYCSGFSIRQKAMLKRLLHTLNRNLPTSQPPLVP